MYIYKISIKFVICKDCNGVHFNRLTQNNYAYIKQLNFTSFESNLFSLLFKTRKHKTWDYFVLG
jgi:hypothetical protein